MLDVPTLTQKSIYFERRTGKDRSIVHRDSPNDCPMFQAFPISVGVANVLDFKSDSLILLQHGSLKKEGDTGFQRWPISDFSTKTLMIKTKAHSVHLIFANC